MPQVKGINAGKFEQCNARNIGLLLHLFGQIIVQRLEYFAWNQINDGELL
jgi:hypothetical protein